MKVSKEIAPESFNAIVETFNPPGSYILGELERANKPSCFNSVIRIAKYKITVEKIEEPIEILQARLQELWDTSENWHHGDALRRKAKELGFELQGDRGNKKK